MKLWLIRHGETELTTQRRYCGHLDPPLTPTGELQARAIGEVLPSIDAVFSSDLRRAVDTATLALGRSPTKLQELRELDFGQFEGLDADGCEKRDPAAYRSFVAQPWEGAPPGGETLCGLWVRCALGLQKVRTSKGATVAVFAHGGSIKAILSLCLGLSPQTWWQLEIAQGTASLIELWDGSATLKALNLGARFR